MLHGDISSRLAPAETVLEDFEDGTWPNGWQGSTAQFSITSAAPLEGTYSIESTAVNARCGHPNIPTSSGATYEYRSSVATLNNMTDLFINAQDTANVLTDSYWFRMDVPNGRIVTWQRVGGVSTLIATSSGGGISYTAGETYTCRYEIPADPTVDPIVISIRDSTDTQLASASGTANHHWASGVLGFGHQGPDPNDKFDYFTEQ